MRDQVPEVPEDSPEIVARIESFGLTIAKKRDEAVAARKASGIEEIWRRCEDAYLGIDDLNRHEFDGANWAKSMTMDGPLQRNSQPRSDEPRSTLFFKMTSRYVDACAARIADLLIPVDDKPFAIAPTPMPDVESLSSNNTPVEMNGAPLPHPQQPGRPLTAGDLAQERIDAAKACAEKAETQIWDWLAECGYSKHLRRVVHDAARIGCGVMKGPVPMQSKTRSCKNLPDGSGYALEYTQSIKPGSVAVDPWNCYPDPACGEDIHNGAYFIEHDTFSEKQLSDLIGQGGSGYIDAQIRKVLKEGPGKRNLLSERPFGQQLEALKFQYDVWHFYGQVKRDDLCLCNPGAADMTSEDAQSVFVILTLVNDSVIRATVNPLDSGELPYDVVAWKPRAGHWAGVGVSEDLFTPQRQANSALRAMLDNAGLSAGAQIVMDQGAVVPANGQWSITRNKIWYRTPDSTVDDVRKAMQFFQVPDTQQSLMNILNQAMQQAEEVSGLPLVAQGANGPNSPDTYGQELLQHQTANTLLRRITKAIDDTITTGQINRYYDWLMMDPAVDEDAKGDHKVVVHGSSAVVERYIQDQALLSMGALVTNPAFGIDPKKWFAEMCRAKYMDPKRLQFTQAELEKIAAAPPPAAPAVQAAQVRAQSAKEIEQMRIKANIEHPDAVVTAAEINANARVKEALVRERGELAYAETERQMSAQNAAARLQEMELKRDLLVLEYTMRHNLSLEQTKSQLAMHAMQENTKKQLAAAELMVRQNEAHRDRQHDAGMQVMPPQNLEPQE